MHGASRPRIVIADDHTLIAEAFDKLLENEFEVVAQVHDGHSLIEAARRLHPSMILVDIGMPLLNGLEAAQRIKRTLPDIKIIYVTINRDPDLVAEAVRGGASGYLPETAAASELVSAIHKALKGEFYVSPHREPVAGDSRAMPEAQLTDRQVEVLQLLAEGRSMREAASVLNLTVRTVAFHKYRIMAALGLRTNAELVQYAIRNF